MCSILKSVLSCTMCEHSEQVRKLAQLTQLTSECVNWISEPTYRDQLFPCVIIVNS